MCSIVNYEAFSEKLFIFIGMEYHHLLIGKLFKNISIFWFVAKDLSLGIKLK